MAAQTSGSWVSIKFMDRILNVPNLRRVFAALLKLRAASSIGERIAGTCGAPRGRARSLPLPAGKTSCCHGSPEGSMVIAGGSWPPETDRTNTPREPIRPNVGTRGHRLCASCHGALRAPKQYPVAKGNQVKMCNTTRPPAPGWAHRATIRGGSRQAILRHYPPTALDLR